MNRRRFLRAGGVVGIGVGLGACSYPMSGMGNGWVRPANLVPVNVSWDRIIRTTTGLRPFRPSGFVVRADRLDDKTVVHNYGHGGSGLSLSWGTASLAADLAVEHEDRTVAVIGSGIIGLTTARVLQRRGFDVSIYAKSLPPNTTSNKLWGGFTPNSGLVNLRTRQWDDQFRIAVDIAYREHQMLVGRGYGVDWINSYSQTDDITPRQRSEEEDEGDSEPPLMPRSYDVEGEILGPGQHPFRTRFARRSPMLRFDPEILLEALMRDVIEFGGSIEVRSFDSPNDFMALSERLIVNCTGLGSREVFGDSEMIPVKGQLTVLAPQPGVNYAAGSMIPRVSGLVLGHVRQMGVESLEVDEEEQTRVMESAMRTFAGMRPPNPNLQITSMLPPTDIPPVERFFGATS